MGWKCLRVGKCSKKIVDWNGNEGGFFIKDSWAHWPSHSNLVEGVNETTMSVLNTRLVRPRQGINESQWRLVEQPEKKDR